MYQQDNILNELQQLSPTLAEIPRVNVFKVPEGYFDILSGQLLLQLHSKELDNIIPIKDMSVPEGYFENLADTIMARIKNEQPGEVLLETHGVSSLVADIGHKNVFRVPEGYFENLPGILMAGIKRDHLSEVELETHGISSLVAEIGRKNVYSVPAGYFEVLSQNLLAQRANGLSDEVTEETRNISELVAGISKKNVFTVPGGYFNGLAEQISAKLHVPAKVISMKSHFSAFRYAAAAVITGLVGLSIFFMLNKNSDTTTSGQTAALLSEANQIIKTNSFDKEFSSVSDAAIVSFLESKGQDVEAALVASLADDKNLPEADDYLINENTLDEVLKTLDLNN